MFQFVMTGRCVRRGWQSIKRYWKRNNTILCEQHCRERIQCRYTTAESVGHIATPRRLSIGHASVVA